MKEERYIKKYPRVKGGKVEIVSDHNKMVNTKPKLKQSTTNTIKHSGSTKLIQKDWVYEENISRSREFGENDLTYRGTFRTKKLIEQEVKQKLKGLIKPLEVMRYRVVKSPKGYRLYTDHNSTSEYDLLDEIVSQSNGGEFGLGFNEFWGGFAEDKPEGKKMIQKLLDSGWVFKRVGKYEILYKPTKKGVEHLGWEDYD